MERSEFDHVLDAVRRLVREDVVPREQEIEDSDAIPGDLRRKAADMGLFGFAIPEQYGGLGLSMREEAELVIELGYTSPAFRSMFGTNNGIAGQVLLVDGSEEQKQRFLPALASGGATASFALTESEAGSDPSTLTTTAERRGDGWVINGTKRFITNAAIADLFMVFARTGPAGSGASGISVFVVDARAPGISVGNKDRKMGQLGSTTSEVHFGDVAAPLDALIGGEGSGFRTAMACLAHGRLSIAALCVGMAGRLVEEMVSYARDRRQSGQPIGQFQLVQAMLADSQTEMYAGRSMVLDAAERFDRGEDTKMLPSCAKYFCSEMVGRVADRAVQVHGGSGYMRGVAVERFYR
ncbi:MAG TPA: acyl-CoA dehydrogenase family protein, partial [Mycobacteriales bacterium]|nr:acyl-CoA dehydrogenase family protein [Mycobacteriales bacterium]